jgi:hypothetical protein
MQKKKLYTTPNVDLSDEEPDPEFHSFILENDYFPPIAQQE